MLPEALSNGLCSLNPDVERMCMVCDMQIDAFGVVKQYKFYPSVMRSKARTTYTQVFEMLQNPQGELATRVFLADAAFATFVYIV
jgi:ribonuclease R